MKPDALIVNMPGRAERFHIFASGDWLEDSIYNVLSRKGIEGTRDAIHTFVVYSLLSPDRNTMLSGMKPGYFRIDGQHENKERYPGKITNVFGYGDRVVDLRRDDSHRLVASVATKRQD